MAQRTTDERVKAVIDVNEDIWNSSFINTANVLSDRLQSSDTENGLSEAELIEIETYLSAHFYALRDPQYQQKKTGRASSTFQGQTGKGLELTWWGQMALVFDHTGILAKLTGTDTGQDKLEVFHIGD